MYSINENNFGTNVQVPKKSQYKRGKEEKCEKASNRYCSIFG